jgi:hypothetical protein
MGHDHDLGLGVGRQVVADVVDGARGLGNAFAHVVDGLDDVVGRLRRQRGGHESREQQ